jgi:acyl-coenzyme A synthetase/AMP-(fatty) acid ligase
LDRNVVRTMTDLVEPSAAFAAQANATAQLAAEATRDPMRFWDEQAGSLTWARGWDEVLDLSEVSPRWFVGGRLSVIASCLDRHIRAGRGDLPALMDVGATGSTRAMSYAELYSEVRLTAAALRAHGIEPGDEIRIGAAASRRAIVIAMLAAAYVGAVHTIVQDAEPVGTSNNDDGLEPVLVDSQHPWCTFLGGDAHFVTHETGPLLTQITYSTRVLLDVKPRDIGWCSLPVTHHLWQLHAVYGTLANGACLLLLDDATHQSACTDTASLQRVLTEHSVDTALLAGDIPAATPSALQSNGERNDERSPRLIAATSPVSEDAWWHLHRNVGMTRAVVTTVWGSPRTGGLIAGPLPGVDLCAPARVMAAMPGVALTDPTGQPTLGAPAPGVRVDVGSRIDSPTDPVLRIS